MHLLRRLLAEVCGEADNSITLCQSQDKENNGFRCVMATGHQTCGWHSAEFIKTEVVGEMFAGPANDRLMEKLSDGFIHTYVLMWVYVFQRR